MLRLNNYLLRTFPNPPPSIDYSPLALQALHDVYGNSTAGNCTVAAAYHINATLLGNSAQTVPFVDQDALTLYEQLSGWDGVEDSPSDVGLDEHQVLNYWAQTGLAPGGHRIVGFVELAGHDAGEIQAALWLFENVYRAGQLPQAWIDGMDAMDNGFVWDVAGPATEEGHAWMGFGYDQTGIKNDTWGLLGTETWAAVAKYGYTYTVLSEDLIDKATQKAENGFNWTQLVSDLQSLGTIQT